MSSYGGGEPIRLSSSYGGGEPIRLSTSAGRGGSGRAARIEYTDVVVIGNGPSGISLSYLLSGNWPYYSGRPHPDSYLQQRLLEEAGAGKSIIEQDLEYLSSGLEGRSSSPVALLFDALTQPDADLGFENGSLLEWQKREGCGFEHVVLGRQNPGGAWQMMDGQMHTLSLGNWMQLPNMPFKEWLRKHRDNDNEPVPQNRATMEDVRTYYEQYVKTMGLKRYMKPHSTVTSVERVLDVSHSVDDESGEQQPCSANHNGCCKWEVRGYTLGQDECGELICQDFCYRAPNVVLATGTYDVPNQLRVPGEHLPYILHSMGELEEAIRSGEVGPDSEPLMVVGAGLSAADAVLVALEAGVPIIHVFRRDSDDPAHALAKLPPKLYPEYRKVLEMMRDGDKEHTYTRYQRHQIGEFKSDGNVLLRSTPSRQAAGGDTVVQVSRVLVLIGSRPDLSFLPEEGKDLGLVPGMQVDSKHNPIDVDPFSYQTYNSPGLFAMGPLVGDNFVRFLRGGALAIASHLWRKHMGKL